MYSSSGFLKCMRAHPHCTGAGIHSPGKEGRSAWTEALIFKVNQNPEWVKSPFFNLELHFSAINYTQYFVPWIAHSILTLPWIPCGSLCLPWIPCNTSTLSWVPCNISSLCHEYHEILSLPWIPCNSFSLCMNSPWIPLNSLSLYH